MIASGTSALAIGLNVEASPLLLLLLVFVYGLTVPADSGALTSGTTASAAAMNRGATLALHSAVGFGLGQEKCITELTICGAAKGRRSR
jgi:hypothetical protein